MSKKIAFLRWFKGSFCQIVFENEQKNCINTSYKIQNRFWAFWAFITGYINFASICKWAFQFMVTEQDIVTRHYSTHHRKLIKNFLWGVPTYFFFFLLAIHIATDVARDTTKETTVFMIFFLFFSLFFPWAWITRRKLTQMAFGSGNKQGANIGAKWAENETKQGGKWDKIGRGLVQN